MIRQGGIYWLHFEPAEGSAPVGRRPALVVQHDRFNRGAISTTVVAAVTSNLRLGAIPGNVRLRQGEAGLPRPSVVDDVVVPRQVAESQLDAGEAQVIAQALAQEEAIVVPR